MLKQIYRTVDNIFEKGHSSIPEEYRNELLQEVLHVNLKREKILSSILLIIDVILLFIDIYVSRGWTRNVHIFGRFSYYHVLLLLVPLFFLILTGSKGVLKANMLINRVLHRFINIFVMSVCAFIAVSNELVGKQPFPYTVAIFCIGSLILLKGRERYFVFGLPYVVYIIGVITVQKDIYHLAADVFFFLLLLFMALVVSSINYSSYIKSFINKKIILEKNEELSSMYKLTEKALIKRTEELNETVEYEKLRAAFFANISHELRTPLTVIYSSEQMLEHIVASADLNDKKKDINQYMTIIKKNCYRLIRLIANLIDITKIDAGYFQVTLQNYDIIRAVEDITLSISKFIEDRDINLIFDTEIEECVIACDPDKIERIMLNLLSNAVKFTPEGGSIHVNIYQQVDTIDIHIRDTGVGIPDDMKESIFERFVQVDKTTSRAKEGSGIGLSIVKALVEMHNGSICVKSGQGKGSEFIVKLPKTRADDEKIEAGFGAVSEKSNIEKISVEFSDIYS